jgi:hypothetical protein
MTGMASSARATDGRNTGIVDGYLVAARHRDADQSEDQKAECPGLEGGRHWKVRQFRIPPWEQPAKGAPLFSASYESATWLETGCRR